MSSQSSSPRDEDPEALTAIMDWFAPLDPAAKLEVLSRLTLYGHPLSAKGAEELQKSSRELQEQDPTFDYDDWTDWKSILAPIQSGNWFKPLASSTLGDIPDAFGVYELGIKADNDDDAVVYCGWGPLRNIAENYVQNGGLLRHLLWPYLNFGCSLYIRWRDCSSDEDPAHRAKRIFRKMTKSFDYAFLFLHPTKAVRPPHYKSDHVFLLDHLRAQGGFMSAR